MDGLVKSGGEKNDCNGFNGDFVNCSYIQPILNQLPKKKSDPVSPVANIVLQQGNLQFLSQRDWDTMGPPLIRKISGHL